MSGWSKRRGDKIRAKKQNFQNKMRAKAVRKGFKDEANEKGNFHDEQER